MTQDEAVAKVNETNATLVKIGTETDALLAKIGELNDALAAAIEAGRVVTPELEAAIQAVDAQAHVVDDKVPDVEPPPRP